MKPACENSFQERAQEPGQPANVPIVTPATMMAIQAPSRRERQSHSPESRQQRAMLRSFRWRKCWSELSDIVNAELLFQFGHLVHRHVKAIAAKGFALNALKLFAHGVILMFADNFEYDAMGEEFERIERKTFGGDGFDM